MTESPHLDAVDRREAAIHEPLRRIRPHTRPAGSSSAGARTPSAGRPWRRCWAARPARPPRRRPRAGVGACRGLTALRRQGQARHLPAHGRRAVADGPVRLQAEDGRVVRQGPARLGPHGPAADDDDLRPGAVPDRARRSTSSPSTARAACGSASCCPTRPRWSTTCASSAACTPRRSTTSRPSRYMQTGNQITGRPCLGSWASLRPGLAEREPADVRRPGRQADATPSRSRRSRPGCGRRATCPASTPASRSAPAATRSCTSTTRRACPPRSAATTLDGLKALNEMNYQQRRRPRDAHPHPAVRAGLPHAVERARADRHRERAGHRPTSSTATRRRSPARFAHTALLARRMVERGVRFVQIYHNNWDTTPTSPAACPTSARTSTSPARA